MAACCVKTIVSSFAVLILLISAGLIAIGIMIFTTDYFSFDIPASYFNFDPEKALEIAGYVFIGGGSFMLLSSIAGIYGSCKIKKCWMSVYWITLLVFFLFLLALTIAFPVVLNPVYDQIKTSNCQYNPKQKYGNLMKFLNQSNEVYVQLNKQVYCRQYDVTNDLADPDQTECICNIKNPNIWTNKFGTDFFDNYTISQTTGVNVVDKCPNFTEAAKEAGIDQELFTNIKGFGAYLENTLECTGVCQGTPFYMFTNINRGLPSNYKSEFNSGGCIQKLENVIDEYKDITFYSVIGALCVVTLNHFLLFYLCCQQKKNPDYLNSYLELTGDRQHVY